VTDVTDGCAASGRVKKGDKVLAINGIPVTDEVQGLALAKAAVGDVVFSILRPDAPLTVTANQPEATIKGVTIKNLDTGLFQQKRRENERKVRRPAVAAAGQLQQMANQTGTNMDDNQSKAGGPVDGLIDKLGSMFRANGGFVGANGQQSKGVMGGGIKPFSDNRGPTAQAGGIKPPVAASRPAVHPANQTPKEGLVDKLGAQLRESSGSVGANGQPSNVVSQPFWKPPPTQYEYASQQFTGVREVQRKSNLHQWAADGARLVNRAETSVKQTGNTFKQMPGKMRDVSDHVVDKPMDGSMTRRPGM